MNKIIAQLKGYASALSSTITEGLGSKKATIGVGVGIPSSVLAIQNEWARAMAIMGIIIAYIVAQAYVDAKKPSP